MNDHSTFHLKISQAESKKVVAIIAHMRQIYRTVFTADNRLTRPIFMDHAETLLAAASLRALFFDDTPAPLLTTFLQKYSMQLAVSSFETDSSMLLLSEIDPSRKGHISDLFAEIILNRKMDEEFKLDEPHSFICVLQEGDPRIAEVGAQQREWAPGPHAPDLENVSLGYQPGTGICQYAQITRRVVDLASWGSLRIGYLKEKPIRRRNVACYVANKLGGVHYDSTRLPKASTDADEFRRLATAYDWDNQAITHAGNVAVGLMCIELVCMPWFMNLLESLGEFHVGRQNRLIRGLPIAPNGEQPLEAPKQPI